MPPTTTLRIAFAALGEAMDLFSAANANRLTPALELRERAATLHRCADVTANLTGELVTELERTAHHDRLARTLAR